MPSSLINRLDRKLTDIFRRTKRRDALLADLYQALGTRDNVQMVHDRAINIAYLYWDSHEVGECIAETLDYYAQFEGPFRAIELAKALIRAVPSGSVFEHVLGCLGRLQAHKDIEDPSRKKTAMLLNNIRMRSSEPGSRVMNTMFCYKEDYTRPLSPDRVMSLEPKTFIHKLRK